MKVYLDFYLKPIKKWRRETLAKVSVVFHNDIFTPWPATSIIHPIETLLGAGHQVTVFSWDKGRDDRFNEPTLPVRRVFVRVPVKGSLSYYLFSRELLRKLVEEKPDLIMAFDLEVLRGAAVAAETLNVPLLYFAREDWPEMVRGNGDFISLIRSKMFRRIEKNLCRKVVSHAYSVNDERGRKYVDWGVPYTTIFTTKSLREIPIVDEKHERFSLAMAGSMHELHALSNILEAIKSVDCDLYLIGGVKENMGSVKELVRKSGIGEKVHITGPLLQEDYLRELGKCHVGLSLPFDTDRNKYYGITVKTWDYMAMGLPSIVSNFPAMISIVEGNGVGISVNPRSPEGIRDAITKLEKNYTVMGRKAAEIFRRKYSWEVQQESLRKSFWIFQ